MGSRNLTSNSHRNTTNKQTINKQTRKMRNYLLLCCTLGLSCAAPQTYSEQAAPLSDDTYATIQEVFGTSEKQVDASGYSNTNTAPLTDSNVDVLVQVIKEADSQYPSDHVQPDSSSLVKDEANVEVDNVFENCDEYTEQFGYECVPYYQCSNGTIITDGAGLIDIRNGFGAQTPEDSKCPGFLDVCCKDPDFIPPPPPPIVKYQPKCGRRNLNGLGARIQGFTESESQFGEWPHMCAVLHAKPVEQEAGYSGEPETVNLYQCGVSLIAPGVILTAAHCVDKFRQNHILIKTEMSRPLPFILSLMEETSRTTLLFSSPMENLFLINISTQPVCPQLMRSLMEQHVLLLDGARISLEPQDNTRWFSRRLIFLSSTMESVKTSSEPQDLDRSTSFMTPSCVLEECPEKTPAREMEAVLLSVPPSTTPTSMSKPVS